MILASDSSFNKLPACSPASFPSAFVNTIPKSSSFTIFPLVTFDVNSFKSSPYTLVLLSIVTVTSLAVIVYVPSTNVTS